MNFLQLVNRARRECGAANADLLTLQGALVLDDRRFRDWINEAWRDIQTRKPDWEWMTKAFEFDTTQGQGIYPPTAAAAPDVSGWRTDTLRAYVADTAYQDEQALTYMDYDVFRNVHEFGPARTVTGKPMVFTVDRHKALRLGPKPDAAYTVSGEYWRAASDLVADTDKPDVPEEYHMLIVWLACLSYGHFEAAPEVVTRATLESTKLMNRLQLDQAPVMQSGAPLA